MAVCESAQRGTKDYIPILRDRIPMVKDFLYHAATVTAKWLDHKEIGRRAKEIRERLKLSQDDMAVALGVPKSQSDIAKLEKGALWKGGEPNVKLLIKLAALGGYGIDYFRVGTPDETRREKLIAAKWMEEMAKRLREEAVATPLDEDGDEDDQSYVEATQAVLEPGEETKETG